MDRPTTLRLAAAAALAARERVRAMTLGNLAADGHKIVDGFFEALARGVRYQVIYGTHVLRDPNALRMVQRCVEAGEEARVFPHIPMNIAIADDRWALVTVRAPGAGGPGTAAVVVHDSPFLAGLAAYFETFWRMAVPITSGTQADDAASDEAKQLLTYLGAGLTDEAIAREMGVSERTIARRIRGSRNCWAPRPGSSWACKRSAGAGSDRVQGLALANGRR
ncbi:hypothetical protein ACFRI7_06455 [Streptomyces sp. NPDC056716]|uniref:hypothetical protein n=1 Tax=unclassified Streptomyces TaxID=2593676 RepID=UPI00367A2E80